MAGHRVDSQQLRVSTAASLTDCLGEQAHFALTAVGRKTCCKLPDGQGVRVGTLATAASVAMDSYIVVPLSEIPEMTMVRLLGLPIILFLYLQLQFFRFLACLLVIFFFSVSYKSIFTFIGGLPTERSSFPLASALFHVFI